MGSRPRDLGSCPGSATNLLCDVGQVVSTLCAIVSVLKGLVGLLLRVCTVLCTMRILMRLGFLGTLNNINKLLKAKFLLCICWQILIYANINETQNSSTFSDSPVVCPKENKKGVDPAKC